MLVDESPESLEESECPFDAGVGPFQRLVRRTREHDEQARGVGAELFDQRLRIDAVVLRLRHLFDTADDHWQAIGSQRRANGPATFVMHGVDLGGIEPLFLAMAVLAV